MALELSRTERLGKLQFYLERADTQFSSTLQSMVRSMLLHRITSSSDKKAELAFYLDSARSIRWGSKDDHFLEDVSGEVVSLLSDDARIISVGRVFSAATSLVDVLTPKELYAFTRQLRKEPIHHRPEDSEVSLTP